VNASKFVPCQRMDAMHIQQCQPDSPLQLVFARNVASSPATTWNVDELHFQRNATHGIQAGTGSNIRRCPDVGNAAAGITGSGINGLKIHRDAILSSMFTGIFNLGQTILKDSFAAANTVAASPSGPGSTVQGCNASDNVWQPAISVISAVSRSNPAFAVNKAATGSQLGNGSTVIGCSSRITVP